MEKINIAAIIGVPAIVLVLATNAQATVTMTLVDATTYAENSGSFNAYVNGNQIINQYDLLGLYNFSLYNFSYTQSSPISPTLPASVSLWATCLSPAGSLDWGTHTYSVIDFATANPGHDPTAWTSGNKGQLWGIQNANYLFTTLSGQILKGISGQVGSGSDQGAALALAMYAALYTAQVTTNLGEPHFPLQV
jgi:hypothetical protein